MVPSPPPKTIALHSHWPPPAAAVVVPAAPTVKMTPVVGPRLGTDRKSSHCQCQAGHCQACGNRFFEHRCFLSFQMDLPSTSLELNDAAALAFRRARNIKYAAGCNSPWHRARKWTYALCRVCQKNAGRDGRGAHEGPSFWLQPRHHQTLSQWPRLWQKQSCSFFYSSIQEPNLGAEQTFHQAACFAHVHLTGEFCL